MRRWGWALAQFHGSSSSSRHARNDKLQARVAKRHGGRLRCRAWRRPVQREEPRRRRRGLTRRRPAAALLLALPSIELPGPRTMEPTIGAGALSAALTGGHVAVAIGDTQTTTPGVRNCTKLFHRIPTLCRQKRNRVAAFLHRMPFTPRRGRHRLRQEGGPRFCRRAGRHWPRDR